MDKYVLKRFKDAQETDYDTALKEIRNGHKSSHWIWYIFPQIKGLGHSFTSRYYALSGLKEAKAYLDDEILNRRLREITKALLELHTDDAVAVMGDIDAMKLRSSMTLFDEVSKDDIFKEVLDKFFDGKPDEKTLEILHKENLS